MEYVKCIVTGGSSGIGEAIVSRLLHIYSDVKVYNLDNNSPEEEFSNRYPNRYEYVNCDVSKFETLPNIEDVRFLVNNAGIQAGSDKEVIDVNLYGVMNCTVKYALNNTSIRAVVNQASVSAHNGAEFLPYCASKGGVLAYTKASAKALAPRATCNSISFGGVETSLNVPIMTNSEKWNEIMNMTLMKKWVSPDEAAEWVIFLLVNNKSMTGQDIIIDNGEMINHKFVW